MPKKAQNKNRGSGKDSSRDEDKNKSRDKNSTSNEAKRTRVVRCIRALPVGTVSSYGAIAKASGWPGAARQVVRILRQVPGLPWHRVVGAGGAIKLPGEGAAEQKFCLRMEGVTFRGARVDMKRHKFRFPKAKGFSSRR